MGWETFKYPCRKGYYRLTEEEVMDIRRRARAGELHKSLAREYAVNPSTITATVNRVNWRHVV